MCVCAFACNVMRCDLMQCDVISWMWFNAMCCNVMWCYVMWCDAMWCDVGCNACTYNATAASQSHGFKDANIYVYAELCAYTHAPTHTHTYTHTLCVYMCNIYIYISIYIYYIRWPSRLFSWNTLPQASQPSLKQDSWTQCGHKKPRSCAKHSSAKTNPTPR